MRPRRPTRLPGFPYVGIYRYSLRFGTNGRQSWFLDAHYVAIAVTQILRTAVAESFLVLAYCFMPDHVHLLVEGTQESSDLRRFARIAKQRTGYAFSTRLGIPAFWQDGYYERVLRSEEATETVVRYIFDNPVRAGLVQRAEDYPFSGGLFWTAIFAQSAKPSASHGQS